FSMRVCAQMLQLAPMRAPARITAYCQTRVPWPMLVLCTSASSWTCGIFHLGEELLVVADVVRFVIVLAGQHHQHAVGGELEHFVPDHAFDAQPLVRRGEAQGFL